MDGLLSVIDLNRFHPIMQIAPGGGGKDGHASIGSNSSMLRAHWGLEMAYHPVVVIVEVINQPG